MRKIALIPAVVLLLLPLVAIHTDGGFGSAIAVSLPWARPDATTPAPDNGLPTAEPLFQPVSAAPPTEPVPARVPVAAAPVVKAPVAEPPAKKPVPSPVQESGGTWVKAPLLWGAAERAMAGFAGTYSIAVQDIKSGERWVLNPEARYHPASTIKMPVTLYALEQFRSGKLGWHDGIVYTEADFESPGGGAFETAPFGGVYPVENLVGRALRYSNNVAVNMLGRHLGWNNIRAWTRTIGGELYRRKDASPEVTVLSELGWWQYLDRLSREDAKVAELVLQPLREVAYDGRISAGLPKGTKHVHKFGSYNGYNHDGSIVWSESPYILVVMTHGAKEWEADAAIAKVAAAIHQVMTSR